MLANRYKFAKEPRGRCALRWSWIPPPKFLLRIFFAGLLAVAIGATWAKPGHKLHNAKHTSAEFVYTSNGLQTYRVSRSGALKLINYNNLTSDDVQGTLPEDIYLLSASPDSNSLFVGGQSESIGKIVVYGSRYAMKPSGGLSLKFPTSFVIGGPDDSPASMAFGAHGRTIYLLANIDKSLMKTFLFQYRVKSDGSIAQVVAPMLVATAQNRSTLAPDPFIAADPKGKNVYISDSQQRHIRQFRVAADGHLTPVASGTIRTAIIPGQMFIPPGGKYVYLSDMSMSHLITYRIASTGKLIKMNIQALGRGGRMLALAFSPDGRFLYCSSIQGDKGTIFSYRIAPGGILKSLPALKTDTPPYMIAIDPAGKFAYGLTNDGHGSDFIRPYRITSSGKLLSLKQFDVPLDRITSFMAIVRTPN